MVCETQTMDSTALAHRSNKVFRKDNNNVILSALFYCLSPY